jgi:hypothetical protein
MLYVLVYMQDIIAPPTPILHSSLNLSLVPGLCVVSVAAEHPAREFWRRPVHGGEHGILEPLPVTIAHGDTRIQPFVIALAFGRVR